VQARTNLEQETKQHLWFCGKQETQLNTHGGEESFSILNDVQRALRVNTNLFFQRKKVLVKTYDKFNYLGIMLQSIAGG